MKRRTPPGALVANVSAQADVIRGAARQEQPTKDTHGAPVATFIRPNRVEIRATVRDLVHSPPGGTAYVVTAVHLRANARDARRFAVWCRAELSRPKPRSIVITFADGSKVDATSVRAEALSVPPGYPPIVRFVACVRLRPPGLIAVLRAAATAEARDVVIAVEDA